MDVVFPPMLLAMTREALKKRGVKFMTAEKFDDEVELIAAMANLPANLPEDYLRALVVVVLRLMFEEMIRGESSELVDVVRELYQKAVLPLSDHG